MSMNKRMVAWMLCLAMLFASCGVVQGEDATPSEPVIEEPVQQPEGPKEDGQMPDGQTPGGETPDGQTPGGETPDGQTPGGETPDGQTPGGETPDGQTPGGETPDGQTPGGETPDGQTPGGETPDGQTPGSETPDGQTPDGQNPGGETPDGQPPKEGEWNPTGEAWAQLADGTRLDGSGEQGDLQELLDQISIEGGKADVYVRTKEEITVENTAEELFERVTLLPDPTLFDAQQYVVTWHTIPSKTRGLPPIVIAVKHISEVYPSQTPTPTPESSPTPTPTPVPVTIQVEAQNLEPGVWKNVAPSFTLKGIEEGSQDYVYGVFVCNERLVLLAEGQNVYTPQEDGQISLRFAVLDMMGDVVSLSDQYDMLLDFIPPEVPYLEVISDTELQVYTADMGSGLDAVSFDGGQTYTPWPQDGTQPIMTGEKGDYVEPGTVVVRDKAGNTISNEELFIFGGEEDIDIDFGGGGGSGGGSGEKPIHHVKETMDYSKANYNALELEFADGPQTELKAGDTVLSLSLTSEDEGEEKEGKAEEEPTLQPFTAKLTSWQRYEGEKMPRNNALVLTVWEPESAALGTPKEQEPQETVTWHFTGDVYKLLYNSGVDFLVLVNGEYMAAIPTEGFTAGTQYAKLKASGVSTRKFAYTVTQDDALRETTITVAVEDETWLLEEDKAQPMYRYNVLIGTDDMMKKPFETYLPEEERSAEADR